MGRLPLGRLAASGRSRWQVDSSLERWRSPVQGLNKTGVGTRWDAQQRSFADMVVSVHGGHAMTIGVSKDDHAHQDPTVVHGAAEAGGCGALNGSRGVAARLSPQVLACPAATSRAGCGRRAATAASLVHKACACAALSAP